MAEEVYVVAEWAKVPDLGYVQVFSNVDLAYRYIEDTSTMSSQLTFLKCAVESSVPCKTCNGTGQVSDVS